MSSKGHGTVSSFSLRLSITLCRPESFGLALGKLWWRQRPAEDSKETDSLSAVSMSH